MDTCPYCGSSAEISDEAIVCQNVRCWEAVVEKLVEYKKQVGSDGDGDSSDNPIVIKCPDCNSIVSWVAAATKRPGAYCSHCHYFFNYTFKANKWHQWEMNEDIQRIVKYIDEPHYWDHISEIIRTK